MRDSNLRPMVAPEANSIFPCDSLNFSIAEIIKEYLVKDFLQFLVTGPHTLHLTLEVVQRLGAGHH